MMAKLTSDTPATAPDFLVSFRPQFKQRVSVLPAANWYMKGRGFWSAIAPEVPVLYQQLKPH